eukprot:3937336-Rhodomonas_salina.2
MPHTPGATCTEPAAFGFDSGAYQGPMPARVPPVRHRLTAAKSNTIPLRFSTNCTGNAAVWR